ncbi:SRPBCC family protein [Streptomyces sp. SID5910]|uniref:SRPBCC family protein n=1 Tax=Streptomyces sp. SID5910 TaxID=2690312 RepID=UPI001368A170|nr:SRPBCC family protein [Streptomyces sp. SID5910]MYR44952.1 SRPBCC family protein [Streptomyces sp. SID5910]
MTPRGIERSTVLTATPDQVWAAVGDFGALADWHPHLPPSTIEDDADPELPGAVRVFAVDGEIVARERLLEHDAGARRYRYALLDPLVLPVGDYVATLAVRPHADGAEVHWSAVYRGADEVVPEVESLFGDRTYATGLAALHARFARPGAGPAV